MSPKIPGHGDVNWGRFVSALSDVGFDGCSVIEIEDKAFEGSREKILSSIRLSKRYLENFVIDRPRSPGSSLFVAGNRFTNTLFSL